MALRNWKPVVGYEGKYEVSNTGLVRSLNYNGTGKVEIMKPNLDKDGYRKLLLYFDGVRKTHRVCRLVAEAHVENPENKPQVNHKNGIKECDYADNLEWCTDLENHKHASETGLTNSGEDKWSAKLTEEKVLKIYRQCETGNISQKELAKKHGVSYSTINHIANKRRWKHLW